MPPMKTCLVSSINLGKTLTVTLGMDMLTYLVLHEKTIFYDVKESIFIRKEFNGNIIVIFKEVKCVSCLS